MAGEEVCPHKLLFALFGSTLAGLDGQRELEKQGQLGCERGGAVGCVLCAWEFGV